MRELQRRRDFTVARVTELRAALSESDEIAEGKACVYATGSYGRCEASAYSDLDVFIVAKVRRDEQGELVSQLSRLEEICLKADLIKTSERMGFPPFSKDGHYLVRYTVHDFIKSLGKPEDDFTNRFTARLLLLLESCSLIGGNVYQEAADEVIAAYWPEYEQHSDHFRPAYLANDILRLWRTFCVNYEAYTDREPDDKRAKRKVQNYKLKHSRLMTCYSAILYLLFIYRKNGTVTPKDAMHMFRTSPTHRIEEMAAHPYLEGDASKILAELLAQYDQFLIATNVNEEELKQKFLNGEQSRQLKDASTVFGDLMFDALKIIGNGSPFHRMLVV
ncbi:nucleotidyltransferase domain-containing protein [Methylocystis sp.]|uniref:nucleotidyltransferase domain-containing protein n=1 Tax=Methylocystis sp. TaxID=1911079 RepID=UPI003DA5F195